MIMRTLHHYYRMLQGYAYRDLYLQAMQKRHSTTEEALSVSCNSGSYRTVLTHFSQRYPKLPVGLEAVDASWAAVAFDGMRLPLTALPDLPLLLPALQMAWGTDVKSGKPLISSSSINS